MYSLPIFLLFPVKNGVFVLGQHLLLARQLLVPTLDSLCRHSPVLLQCSTDRIYDFVDKLEAFALSCFLRCGESPWDFPGQQGLAYNKRLRGIAEYHSNPPERGAEGLNIVLMDCNRIDSVNADGVWE